MQFDIPPRGQRMALGQHRDELSLSKDDLTKVRLGEGQRNNGEIDVVARRPQAERSNADVDRAVEIRIARHVLNRSRYQ